MNLIVRGVCRAYSNEGKGIVNANNLTIFVNGLLLGEDADIEITWSNDKIAHGKVVKLHFVSPDRIPMQCPVGTSCGGCSFQALSYAKEVEFKKDKIVNAFRIFGKTNIALDGFVASDLLEFYRNKIQVPYGLNNLGQITYGFYKAFSHDIVPFKKCYIESETANEIVQTIRQIMVEEGIPPYNEKRGTGVVRHVMVRTSHDHQQVMVVVVTAKQDFRNKDFFFRKIIKKHPEVTSLIQNINSKDTNVILGEREKTVFGLDYLEDELSGLKLRISSKSFYQVNHQQTEKLYQKAIELANLQGNETMLDAYCGVGSIGLAFSKHVKKVVGVEIIEEAIVNANTNKAINNIKNVEFYTGDVDDVIKKLKTNFDLIVVDPPRKGLSNQFKDFLLEKEANKIIYISCDPNTLARDTLYFKEKYEIKKVYGLDMFPRTYHVESIVLFELKK